MQTSGKLIVLTAPLTETIDHAGYFIQMALASLPKRMEGIINQKYPTWRNVERNEDGSARYMPAGVRLVEASLSDDPGGLRSAVEAVMTVTANSLDQAARLEFERLAQAIAG